MLEDIDEIQTEILTFHQFLQSIAGEEVHGIPGEIAYPVKKLEPIPGNDLAKHRVRVSFDFDVSCNDGAILNSGNDDDVKAHDLALLKSFLQTPQLIDMLVDTVGTELGLHGPETFLTRFLPQINTDCHHLFSEAIERLSGENQEYWRDIRDASQISLESLLSMCVEHIFECFQASFVSSSYEVLDK